MASSCLFRKFACPLKLEEGKKIGLDEGEKIGRKGREVEIARELKKNGVNIDIIVASTGLTKKEIENL